MGALGCSLVSLVLNPALSSLSRRTPRSRTNVMCMCGVRRCKHMVTNHINTTLTDNKRVKVILLLINVYVIRGAAMFQKLGCPSSLFQLKKQLECRCREFLKAINNKTRSSATAEIARDAEAAIRGHSRSSVVVPIDATWLVLNSNLTYKFNRSWQWLYYQLRW